MLKPRLYLVLGFFCLLQACGTKPLDVTDNNEAKYSIVGEWYKGIQPGLHAFLEDGSYHIHLPGEHSEKGEIAIKGNWKIKGNELITEHDDGYNESKRIHWLNQDQFFLGDYDPKVHKSQDEDGMYSRVKEE